ncbi:MAG: hypothetical protein U5N26_11185 [Candidatus Marinimicrobia bacterium]|nr:hypothetical protein [Candidatus Neomarinimicrobiota bacterium]
MRLKISKILATCLLTGSSGIRFPGQDGVDPGIQKWINVGSLQSNFAAGGAERAWNNVYYEGMRWPAWYSYTDNHVIDRQWLVCKNYTSPEGREFSHLEFLLPQFPESGLRISRGASPDRQV